MLSACIMKRHASIFAACDKEVTQWRIRDLADRLVKLREVVADASLLDIEDAHSARLETAREYRQ